MAKTMRQIVRVANVDLDADKKVAHQLTRIRGVGPSFANMICTTTGVEGTKKTSDLAEKDIKAIEVALKAPKAPAWMLNRRGDPETGEDKHLVGTDVRFVRDNDIKILRKIKSYKGMRHAVGLPVRGQRTKSNFRRNKGKVTGVKRKKKE